MRDDAGTDPSETNLEADEASTAQSDAGRAPEDAGTARQDPTRAPQADAPTATRPRVERPEADAPTAERPAANPEPELSRLQAQYDQADPEFRRLFWKLVIVYKLGLLGLVVGLLVVAFRSSYAFGPPLAVGGGVLLAYGIYLTWRGKTRLDADEFDFEGDDGPADERDDDPGSTAATNQEGTEQ